MPACIKCNSNCATGDCGCIPQGLSTPAACPGDLPTCSEPSPCNETFNAQCVYYTGVGNTCLGIESGQNMETVVNNLATQFAPFICLECASLILPATGSTAIPSNQILSWNMIPGASSYDVYLGTSSTVPVLVSLGQVSTSYTPLFPLLPDTAYYWKVIPYNLAGVPVASCPTFTFNTTPAACLNPLQNFFDDLLSTVPEVVVPATVTANLISLITTTLNLGELLTNCNYCCPDCTSTNRYVLASSAVFSEYYSQVYSPTCVPPCCIEVDSSLTALTNTSGLNPSLSASFAAVPPNTNCCGTNFSECAIRIKNILPNNWGDIFKTLGVVEESSFTGNTTLCIVADFIEALPVTLTEAQKASIIGALLGVGFVVDCRAEGTIISSVATYITYLTSVSEGGCLCYEPCTP